MLFLCLSCLTAMAQKIVPLSRELAVLEEKYEVSFVYEGNLVEGIEYSGPGVADKSLRKALQILLKDTDIDYKIDGRYVILIRRPKAVTLEESVFDKELPASLISERREASIGSTGLGSMEIPKAVIMNSPVLFGERDVLRTVQLMPGVQNGAGSFAGFSVRGGSESGNLVLLDGIPVYNPRHALGIFSVFPPDAVESARFYKGSFPARYGGRTSSVLDVTTADGSRDSLHLSYTIGLIASKIHSDGPIGRKMTFSLSGRMVHTGFADPLFKAFKLPMNYYFYDVHGKLTCFAGPGDRISANFYHGRDYFRQTSYETLFDHYYDANYAPYDKWTYTGDESLISWGNTIASAIWTHVFSERLFVRTTAAFSKYSMIQTTLLSETVDDDGIESTFADKEVSTPYIRDFSAKVDFVYETLEVHNIKFGLDAVSHTFVPDRFEHGRKETVLGKTTLDTLLCRFAGNPVAGFEASVHAEDDMVLGAGLSVNPGVRVSLVYAGNTPHICLEPRLSMRYEFRPGVAFKAGYSRMSQAVHQLSSGSVSLPTDVWVPMTGRLLPEVSDQVSAGFFCDALPGWRISIEGWGKWMQNVTDYKYTMPWQREISVWRESIVQGIGRAWGVEALLEKTAGKLTGWASYTLSKSDRCFPNGSINRGRWYPFVNDRRHNFGVYVNYKLSARADLSANWTIASGNRFTLPEYYGRIAYGGDTRPEYVRGVYWADSRNNYVLPPTHRLDLSLIVRKALRRGSRAWSFGLYNAYFAKNPDQVYLYEYRGNGRTGEKRLYPDGRMGIMTLSFLTMIPSVSFTRDF